MVSFGFFNSSNGDRKYSADDISRIFSYLITDGILATYGDKFFTTPSTSKLGVVLGTGWAWFNHTWTQSDTAIPFDVDEPDPSLDRFDAIYLKVDRRSLGRVNSLGLVKGTAAINPQKPTFPTETDVFYHPLAYVKVRHGVTRIAASDIEILCGKTQAPFITSILQTTDITTLFQGWSEQFGTKMAQWQTAYDTQMSNQQSGYTAKINEWEGEVDSLVSAGSQQMSSQQTQFSSKMTQWQNQFTTRLTNQNTTFTTSLNGWEADFTEWFENLQTYLSQDVVTAIWADIEALKTKNTQQDTEIANKLNISAKATSSQMTNNTSGDYWVDPAQVHSKILADCPEINLIHPTLLKRAGRFFPGTSINSVVQTEPLTVKWTEYSKFSESGIIATPIGSGGYFLGWFATPSIFEYVFVSADYPTCEIKQIVTEHTEYENGSICVRLIPVSEVVVYLGITSRHSNSTLVLGLYRISQMYSSTAVKIYEGAYPYILSEWKPMGFSHFLITRYSNPSGSSISINYFVDTNAASATSKTTTISTNISSAYKAADFFSFKPYNGYSKNPFLTFGFRNPSASGIILNAVATYNTSDKSLFFSNVMSQSISFHTTSISILEWYVQQQSNNNFHIFERTTSTSNSFGVSFRKTTVGSNQTSTRYDINPFHLSPSDPYWVYLGYFYSDVADGPIIINNRNGAVVHFNGSRDSRPAPLTFSNANPIQVASILRMNANDYDVSFPLIGNVNSRIIVKPNQIELMGGSYVSANKWLFWFQVCNGTISFISTYTGPASKVSRFLAR